MALNMSFWGKFGSSCHIGFDKRKYLAKHPEYAEWRDYLVDLPVKPWTKINLLVHRKKQTKKRT
jgi:hypothetical protein